MKSKTPFSITLKTLLSKIIELAKLDGVITEDELKIINSLTSEVDSIESKISSAMENKEAKDIVYKIFENSSVNLIQNIISQARSDGVINKEEQEIINQLILQLGWKPWEHDRKWYIFKVTVEINIETNMRDLLEGFDKTFCLANIKPLESIGLCLGTKHFVIDDCDVTLLNFAYNPINPKDWIKKGAFASIVYENLPKFKNDLRTTAQDLIAEYKRD
ncbi:MAG: TerB family tellurite resistance protein [Candidatus Heimdallarchaeota archaeon]|nr:TerB family tellurite resistance protein [Candidatus Heimdallarchaeota archaeon]MDH5644990.1 TerB family tellurite resistance protein [Candidatus Heimdallarchaeota archaeon]